MRKRIYLIALLSLIVFGGIVAGAYYFIDSTFNVDTIYQGVKIDGYDMSHKTKVEALRAIKYRKQTEEIDKSMTAVLDDFKYNIRLEDLGYSYNYGKAVEEAYMIGREGNLLQRFKTIKEAEKKGINLALESYYNRERIKGVVNEISQKIDLESKDAQINFNKGKFSIVPEVPGRKVQKEKLAGLIESNIHSLQEITIPIEIVEAKIKKESLSRINGVIGEFSTSFKGSSADRIENIRLSAKALSNKLILPGEEVSYNETTGPREKEFGYKEANVIIGGELTPGIGGGVCQTSTTLYNALLLSDMTILERHPHSIAASYVPKGQDGAVAYGYLDLKFRNDFDFPVYTYSKLAGDRLYFYIYGDTNVKDYKVKIESEVVETIPYKVIEEFDPKAEPGSKVEIQKGRTGYKVKTYKSIIKNGKLISKKQISFDYYREKDFIYKVGPPAPKTVYNEEEEAISLDPIVREP